MRYLAGALVASLVIVGTVSVACGDDRSEVQGAPSGDTQRSLDAYFREVANVSAAHQASRLAADDPLDPYSPEVPPIVDVAASALAKIEAPSDVAGLHEKYAKSVKAFADAALALSGHHDEIVAIVNGATPSAEIARLFGGYESASTAVGDACVNLQDVANANKIDIDIGCRDATAEFKCYSTNASGASRASNFEDARTRVEAVVGPNVPIPSNIPSWVTDYQVGLDTKPVEPGDPDAADIRFANYDDHSRPQVALAFTPRPKCSGFGTPVFTTTAHLAEYELKIVSDRESGVFKGVESTLKLSDIVVTITASWETESAPDYAAMVPTIVEWASLVIEADTAP